MIRRFALAFLFAFSFVSLAQSVGPQGMNQVARTASEQVGSGVESGQNIGPSIEAVNSIGEDVTDGIYHQLYMPVECPGLSLFANNESYRGFNANFIGLMEQNEANNCSIPFLLNVKGYTRHLILDGQASEYDSFFQTMVRHYAELRAQEEVNGAICAEQAALENLSRDDGIEMCPSDHLLRLLLAANETWYRMFFSGEDQASAAGTALAVIGTSGGIWGALAMAVPLLRSKTTKLLSAMRRYLMRPRTVNFGARAGTVGTAASTQVRGQEEVISRSTEDFPSPMTFFEGSPSFLERAQEKVYGVGIYFRDRLANLGVSLAMITPGTQQLVTELPYPRGGSFAAQTYNPEDDIMDVMVGATAVMGTVMFWEGVARYLSMHAAYGASAMAAARGLFGRGVRGALGGLAKIFGSFAGRYATGFVGAFATATPVLKYIASRRFHNRIEQFQAEKDRLENIIATSDLRELSALQATEEYVSLMKNFVLMYTGGRVLRLDQIEMDLEARLMCGPLAHASVSGDHFSSELIEQDMRASSQPFVNRANEVFEDDIISEYFNTGLGLAYEAMQFLEEHATHPFYADTKADMYSIISYLTKYQYRYSYVELMGRKVDVKTPIYMENIGHLQVAKAALETGRPMVPDGLTNQEWEDFYAAREFFLVEKVGLELTGSRLRCDPRFYHRMFGLDYYRYHTPCDINRPEVDERYCLAN